MEGITERIAEFLISLVQREGWFQIKLRILLNSRIIYQQKVLDLDHAEIMRLRCNLSARVYKLVPFLETALTQ